MSLNKRECRRYADPGLKFSPGNGLLHTDQIAYVVRTAIKSIAGRRVLAVYLYDRAKAAAGDCAPTYAVFQTKDDYTTLARAEDGSLKGRSARFWNLLQRGYGPQKLCAFYTQRDEQRVTRYCAIEEKSGLDALEKLQSGIMASRLKTRVMARERKIIQRMESVPAAPRGLNGWIHREVLPAYVFYQYRKGKKPMDGYCTACRHDVSVTGARHNQAGKCPRCGKSVTFKPIGRIGKLFDRVTAQVIQRTGENGIVVRIFKVSKSYRDFREAKPRVWENARIFVEWDQGKTTVTPFYYSYWNGILTHWRKGIRPVMNKWAVNFEQDACGHLYTRGLDGALAGTPWQYSQLEQFYLRDGMPLEVVPYLLKYLRHLFIEYLVKMNLHRLARDVVYAGYAANVLNEHGKSLRDVLGVEKDDVPILQVVDVDREQLRLFKALKAQGVRAEEALLRWYAEHKIGDTENVLRPLQYMTQYKLTQYIDGQFERLREQTTQYGERRYRELRRVLSEYNDYLALGLKLNYDFTGSFALFPRDLQAAHDLAVELCEKKRTAKLDRQLAAAFEALTERYGYTGQDFAVLVPRTSAEIIAEGHALHHCVGGFVESIAQGKRTLLFLRRADNLKKPFVTFEIRDGEIVQTSGYDNGAPPQEVKKFLDRWKKTKLYARRELNAA